MKKNKTNVICLTLLVINLFSCNNEKKPKADFEIKKNETFEVSLKANPSTGYSWKWIKNDVSKIIDSVGATYAQDKNPEAKLGVGGNELFKFMGKESGTDTLVFEYNRSWESNSTLETKKFVVKVN
jgi:inhibitor of cysteine peptidase